MTDHRLLFTLAELAALGRCPHCGWHVKTQGHHPGCVHTHSAPDPATRTARFLARQCLNCAAPASAGRLRCDTCHDHHRTAAP